MWKALSGERVYFISQENNLGEHIYDFTPLDLTHTLGRFV
jgi:hypothetical protein